LLKHIIYILIISLPFYGYSFLNVEIRGIRFDWTIIAVLFFLFICSSAIHKVKIVKNSLFFWLLLFNIALAASSICPLYSGNSMRIVDYLTTWSQYVVCSTMFFIFLNIRLSIHDLQNILKLYLFMALVVSVFGIIQFVGSYFGVDLYPRFTNIGEAPPHSSYEHLLGPFKRPTSFFNEPRIFGNFLVTPFIVSFLLFISGSSLFQNRSYAVVYTIILVLGIILSLSLSAYLCTLILLLIAPWEIIIDKLQKLKLRLFIILLILFTAIYYITSLTSFSPIFHTYVQARIHSYREGFGLSTYIYSTVAVLDRWLKSPLTGIGLNNIYPEWAGTSVMPPFQLLGETGIFGAFSFACFLFVFFSKLSRFRKINTNYELKIFSSIAFVIFISAIVKSFVGSNYGYSSTWFWFDLALSGIIYSSLINKNRKLFASFSSKAPTKVII